MIPYKIWSIIRINLSNLANPYYMPNEFFNWIKYRYYPIVSWTQETLSSGKLAQYFDATNYGKWWLPITITITDQSSLSEIIKVRLTSQEPSKYLNYKNEQVWILVDIQQAGKYVFQN